MQDKLVFVTDQTDISQCPNIQFTGAKYQEIQLKSGLGRYISFTSPNSHSSIFVFHGNAGSICDRLILLNRLRTFMTDIFLIEYPGFAGSNEELSDKNFFEHSLDLVNYLKPKGSKKLVIFGESLGTGVATFVASQIEETNFLVLQSPYTSIVDVAKYQYPYFPVEILLKHRFDMTNITPEVQAEVYTFYGSLDNVIPARISKDQSKRFRNLKLEKEFLDKSHYNIRSEDFFWEQLEIILN